MSGICVFSFSFVKKKKTKKIKRTFRPLPPLRRLGRPALEARLEAAAVGRREGRVGGGVALDLVAGDGRALAGGGRGATSAGGRSFWGWEGGGARGRGRSSPCSCSCSSRHRVGLLCFFNLCFVFVQSRESAGVCEPKRRQRERGGYEGGKRKGRRRRGQAAAAVERRKKIRTLPCESSLSADGALARSPCCSSLSLISLTSPPMFCFFFSYFRGSLSVRSASEEEEGQRDHLLRE